VTVPNGMAEADEEIDRLYQLPLAAFIRERDALAKRVGRAAPGIGSLQKPVIAAWAVNQLYWQARPLYDRLVGACERLRDEHRKHLEGNPSDVTGAEHAHRDAVRAARDRVRAILSASGDPLSAATLQAVRETLEALPVAGTRAGRLTRPVKRMGLEALSGVIPRASAGARPARVVPFTAVARGASGSGRRDGSSAPAHAKQAPREAQARRRAIARLRARERARRAAVGRAKAAVRRAEAELDRAEREARRRSEALAAARAALDRLRRDS
jgi:hypothetical protein